MILLKFSEFIEKDALGTLHNGPKEKVPGYLKVIKIRKCIGNFIGGLGLLYVIGGFISFGFLKGLLNAVITLIVYWVINIVLNLIYIPIYNSMFAKFMKRSD